MTVFLHLGRKELEHAVVAVNKCKKWSRNIAAQMTELISCILKVYSSTSYL